LVRQPPIELLPFDSVVGYTLMKKIFLSTRFQFATYCFQSEICQQLIVETGGGILILDS